MRTLALLSVLSVAGCWDFDALRRAPDDLAGAPDLANADLGVGDLAVGDLPASTDSAAPPDLATTSDLACVRPLGTNPTFVQAGASGGNGTSAQPFGTLNDALIALSGSGGTIFMTGGAYPESDGVPTGVTIVIYGGFVDNTFTCRSPSTAPTIVNSLTSGSPALSVPAGTQLTLDGIALAGLVTPGAASLALDVSGQVTLHGCAINAQPPSTGNAGTLSTATAVQLHHGATLIADHTTFSAGGSSPSSPAAISANSATMRLDDCTITVEQANGTPAFGVGVHGHDSGFAMIATLNRTLVSVYNSGGAATAILATNEAAAATVDLEGSAAVVLEGSPGRAYQFDQSGAFTNALTMHGSTLSVMSTSGVGLLTTCPQASATIGDSILAGPLAIDLATAGLSAQYSASGVNLLDSTQSSAIVLDETADGGVTSLSMASYRQRFADPNAMQGNPLFKPDGYHLSSATSAAVDHASSCVFSRDLDGDARPDPPGGSCDIGADEL